MKLVVSLRSMFPLCVLIVFELICVFTSADDINVISTSKRITKRNELDMQICIDNFDVHEDTIIRTQDSRWMGAKYINESDLRSREDCLKLCCETTSCDVFVFEEKYPGSCYLFNCGPSDDFKCKFTKHRQYTSAILTINRHTAELENEIQHSKQEQELTRLRVSAGELIPSSPIPPNIVSTVPTPTKEATQLAPNANASITKPETRGGSGATYGSDGPREKCSRYQFECRSTGECIAIYNACDGIPQCADGSDEGSELDCPSSSTSIHPQNTDEKSLPQDHPHLQQKVEALTTAETHLVTSVPKLAAPHLPPPNQLDNFQGNRGEHSLQSVLPAAHQMPPQLAQLQPKWPLQQQQLSNQYNRPMAGVRGGYNPDNGIPFPSQRQPQYPSEEMAGQPDRSMMPNQWPLFRGPSQQEWFPHQPVEGSNVGPQYDDNGPNRHIFNHKDGGLVADSDRYIHMRIHPNQYNMPNYGEGPQGEYSSVDGKVYIGQADSYFNTPYRQPVQSNWPLTHQQIGLSGDMHQQNENVKGLREEASRKRPNPPLPAPEHEIIPSSERRPIALPPDYYYEDSSGGRHPTNSQSHSGNSNYQQSNGISPTHNQVEQQKAGTTSNHNAPPENNQEKMKKEEDDLEESPLKHAKNTQKAAALKVMTPQHVLPVHSSVKHESATQNNEEGNDVPDGESGRPKGAILSLTLGMGITAIMIALMAWRIRVIKRRLRRVGGKSPYAHDADYLVNGMYL